MTCPVCLEENRMTKNGHLEISDFNPVPTAPTRRPRPSPLENYGRQMTPATANERPPPPVADVEATDSQKQHADEGKLPMSRLPWGPLKEVVKVLVYGKKKYGSWTGWHGIPNGGERLFESAMRHGIEYALGNRIDPESGLHHLAHMACDVLMVLRFEGFK